MARRPHGGMAFFLITLVTLGVLYGIASDRKAPKVVPRIETIQSVPPAGTPPVSVCTPGVFFLNRPYKGNIKFNVLADPGSGGPVPVDLTEKVGLLVLQSHQGNPIVVLAPRGPYPERAEITAKIIVSDGSDITEHQIRFQTGPSASISLVERLGFEEEVPLFFSQGDFRNTVTQGDVSPREGNMMAALSTGEVFGGKALNGTTSMLSIGPFSLPGFSIPRIKNLRLKFEYDFISEEFDEYVGSKYDDAFLVVVSGPKGAAARLVTSVNLVGKEASTPVQVTGMQRSHEHTGWRTMSLAARVGDPACLTFLVTDVGDTKLASVITLDSLKLH